MSARSAGPSCSRGRSSSHSCTPTTGAATAVCLYRALLVLLSSSYNFGLQMDADSDLCEVHVFDEMCVCSTWFYLSSENL
ncbi:Lactoylglutathione lyase / glyoxalase I family protein, partial [Zea mays]